MFIWRYKCMISIIACMSASDQYFLLLFVLRRNIKAKLLYGALPYEVSESHTNPCDHQFKNVFVSTVYPARRTILFCDSGVAVVRLRHTTQTNLIYMTLFSNVYWKSTTSKNFEICSKTSWSGSSTLLRSILLTENLLKRSHNPDYS
jgi:hypothetical protein